MGLSGRGDAWPRAALFHAGRLFGYAAVGARCGRRCARCSVRSARPSRCCGRCGPSSMPLRLALGLWLLCDGAAAGLDRALGRAPRRARRSSGGQAVSQWHAKVRPLGIGALWVAWPCGLLQSALAGGGAGAGPGLGCRRHGGLRPRLGARPRGGARAVAAPGAAPGAVLPSAALQTRWAVALGRADAGGRLGLGAGARPVDARRGLLRHLKARAERCGRRARAPARGCSRISCFLAHSKRIAAARLSPSPFTETTMYSAHQGARRRSEDHRQRGLLAQRARTSRSFPTSRVTAPAWTSRR